MYNICLKVLILTCIILAPPLLYSQDEIVHRHHRKQVQAVSSDTIPALIPVRAGDLWGYARPGAEIVIKPQFEEAGMFSRYLANGALRSKGDRLKYLRQFPVMDHAYALVKKDSLYGLIDERGQYLVAPVSQWPFGYFPVDQHLVWIGVPQPSDEDSDSERYSVALFDQSGRMEVPFQYEIISVSVDCTNELSDDPYGNQSLMNDFNCFSADMYSNYIAVNKDGKCGYIRKKDFQIEFPADWYSTMPPRDGKLLASYLDTIGGAYELRWVLVGPGNKRIKAFPASFQIIGNSVYGPFTVREGEHFGFVNNLGDWAFPEKFKYAYSFTKNGYALVQALSGNWKVIDKKGRVKVDSIFEGNCRSWCDGYCIQLKDSLFYLFDRHFKQIGNIGLKTVPDENCAYMHKKSDK